MICYIGNLNENRPMNPLDNLKRQKVFIFDNIIVAIFLSFGISFIVSALTDFFEDDSCVFLISGLCFLLLVVIMKIFNFYSLRKHQICTEALLVVDDQARLGRVYRYYFNEIFVSTLISICHENNDFKECWNKNFKKGAGTKCKSKYVSQDYVSIKKIIDEEACKYYKDTEICKLVNELTEYIFIEWLSRKLELYYGDNTKNITVLHRDDIADYLLKNRVLDLMSKPFEDREKFHSKINDKDSTGNIYALVGDDNIYYNKLELKLPPKTKLKKEGEETLILSGKYFKIKFYSSFKGFNADIPYDFHRFYISTPNMMFYSNSLRLEISLKPFYFLLSSNWDNLLWIDSVCDSFLHDFSYKTFIEDIGFDKSITNLMLYDRYLKNTLRSESKINCNNEENHQ